VGQAEAVQLGHGLAEQAVLARMARRAGRRQDIAAGAATGVGGDLGQLDDVAKLVGRAQLALADRPSVRIAQGHQPVGELLATGSLLDLGGDALAVVGQLLQPPPGTKLGLGAATPSRRTSLGASVRASPIDRARIRPAWALSSMTASRR
jgi:hypothetical protein